MREASAIAGKHEKKRRQWGLQVQLQESTDRRERKLLASGLWPRSPGTGTWNSRQGGVGMRSETDGWLRANRSNGFLELQAGDGEGGSGEKGWGIPIQAKSGTKKQETGNERAVGIQNRLTYLA